MVDLRGKTVASANFDSVRHKRRDHPNDFSELENQIMEVILAVDKHKGAHDSADIESLVASLGLLNTHLGTCINEKNTKVVNNQMGRLAVLLLYLVRHSCVKALQLARNSRELIVNKLQTAVLQSATGLAIAIALVPDVAHSALLYNFALEFLDCFGIFPPEMNSHVWKAYVDVFIPRVGEVHTLMENGSSDNPIISPLIMRIIQHYLEVFPEDENKQAELHGYIHKVSEDKSCKIWVHLLDLLAYGDLVTKKKAYFLLKTNFPKMEFIQSWDWNGPYVEPVILSVLSLFQEDDIEANEYGLKLMIDICQDALPPPSIMGQLLAGSMVLLDVDASRMRSAVQRTYSKEPSGSRSGTLQKKNKKKAAEVPNPQVAIPDLMIIHERKTLFDSILFPWLVKIRDSGFKLPESDVSLFCEVLLPTPPEFALEVWGFSMVNPESGEYKSVTSLRRLGTLMESDKLGDTFHILMPRWLSHLSDSFKNDLQVMEMVKSGSEVLCQIFDSEFVTKEKDGLWHFIFHRFRESPEGAQQATEWLNILTKAGVLIPPAIITELCLGNKHPDSLEQNIELLKTLWKQIAAGIKVPLAYDQLFELLLPLNTRAHEMNQLENPELARDILNLTIALSLFVLGCPLGDIYHNFFASESDPSMAPSSAGLSNTPPTATVPLQANSPLIWVLLFNLNNKSAEIRESVISCFHVLFFVQNSNPRSPRVLTTESLNVTNLEDFSIEIQKWVMESLWEMLSPLYNTFVDKTIEILLYLIGCEHAFFHSVVHNAFGQPGWHDRYHALDILYSFFSKVEIKHEFSEQGSRRGSISSRSNSRRNSLVIRDNASVKSGRSNSTASSQTPSQSGKSQSGGSSYSPNPSLCSVFTFFFKSLSDPESLVRSQAQTLLQSFNYVQLEGIAVCFEELITTASPLEKTNICRELMRLNAVFPTLLVLRWSVIIDLFEEVIPGLKDDTTADSKTLRSQKKVRKNSKKNIWRKSYHDLSAPSETEELTNLKAALITLTLQMLGNGVSIHSSYLSSLKYIFAAALSFSKPEQEITSNSQSVVNFGPLRAAQKDGKVFQQTMLVSFVTALAKVLDAESFLVLERPTKLPEVDGETEMKPPTKPNNIGKDFVPFVLMMFSGEYDLASLDQMMLASWLKLILIVIFKYDVESKTLQDIILRILALLSGPAPVSEECKQLVIACCAALVQKSPILTLNMIPKIFPIIGSLINADLYHRKQVTCLRALSFFSEAIEKFRVAPGFFIHLFKSVDTDGLVKHHGNINTATLGTKKKHKATTESTSLDQYDLTLILKHAFAIPESDTDNTKILHKHADYPLRDIFGSILQFFEKTRQNQIDAGRFAACMANLFKFIDQVYNNILEAEKKAPSKDVLDALADFLQDMTKPKYAEIMKLWNLSPVFNVVAAIQRKCVTEHSGLSLATKQLVQFALATCEVSLESVANLCFSGFGSSVVDMLAEKLGAYFLVSQNSSVRQVNSLDTLLHYTQVVALTLFDPIDVPDLPNNEISDEVKVMFRERQLRHPSFSENLFVSGLSYLYHYQTRFRDVTSVSKLYQCGRWISLLVVGLWKYSEDPKSLFPHLFSAGMASQKIPRCLSWLLYGIIHLGYNIDLIEIFAANSAIMADSIQSCLDFDHSFNNEAVTRGFFIIKAWTFISVRMANNDFKIEETVKNLKKNDYALNLELKLWNLVWPSLKQLLTFKASKKLKEQDFENVKQLFLETILFLQSCGSEIFTFYAAELAVVVSDLETKNELRDPVLFQLRHQYEIWPVGRLKQILAEDLGIAIQHMKINEGPV